MPSGMAANLLVGGDAPELGVRGLVELTMLIGYKMSQSDREFGLRE